MAKKRTKKASRKPARAAAKKSRRSASKSRSAGTRKTKRKAPRSAARKAKPAAARKAKPAAASQPEQAEVPRLTAFLIELTSNPDALRGFQSDPEAAMGAALLSDIHKAVLRTRNPNEVHEAMRAEFAGREQDPGIVFPHVRIFEIWTENISHTVFGQQ